MTGTGSWGDRHGDGAWGHRGTWGHGDRAWGIQGHRDMEDVGTWGHVTQDMRGHGTRDTGTWGDTRTHGCTCTDTHGVSCTHACTHTYMRTHTWTRVHTHTDTRLRACSGLLPHPHGVPVWVLQASGMGERCCWKGPTRRGCSAGRSLTCGGCDAEGAPLPPPGGLLGCALLPLPGSGPSAGRQSLWKGAGKCWPPAHIWGGGGGTYNDGAFSASYRLRFILVIPRGTVAPVLKAAAHTGRSHFRSFVRVQSIVSPSVPVTGSRPQHGDGL